MRTVRVFSGAGKGTRLVFPDSCTVGARADAFMAALELVAAFLAANVRLRVRAVNILLVTTCQHLRLDKSRAFDGRSVVGAGRRMLVVALEGERPELHRARLARLSAFPFADVTTVTTLSTWLLTSPATVFVHLGGVARVLALMSAS